MDEQVLHLLHVPGVQRGGEHYNNHSRIFGKWALRVGLQKLEAIHERHFHVEQNQRRAGGEAAWVPWLRSRPSASWPLPMHLSSVTTTKKNGVLPDR